MLVIDRTPSSRRFLAGSLAGVTSQFLTYPLDMARARMAVTRKCTYSSLPEVSTVQHISTVKFIKITFLFLQG